MLPPVQSCERRSPKILIFRGPEQGKKLSRSLVGLPTTPEVPELLENSSLESSRIRGRREGKCVERLERERFVATQG